MTILAHKQTICGLTLFFRLGLSNEKTQFGSAPIMGTEQPYEARQEDPTVNGGLEQRQEQSEAIRQFVDDTYGGSDRVVVVGDFNEFEFVSPVESLEHSSNPELHNAINDLPSNERYTFISQGNSQAVDHLFFSDMFRDDDDADYGIDIVHVNSEFAETKERASDHDPLLAYFEC